MTQINPIVNMAREIKTVGVGFSPRNNSEQMTPIIGTPVKDKDVVTAGKRLLISTAPQKAKPVAIVPIYRFNNIENVVQWITGCGSKIRALIPRIIVPTNKCQGISCNMDDCEGTKRT